jgi:hypothetical protein
MRERTIGWEKFGNLMGMNRTTQPLKQAASKKVKPPFQKLPPREEVLREKKEEEPIERIPFLFWKPAAAIFSPLATFLRCVVEGEQQKAELMLQTNPALALERGQVTDLSKRTFENITGLQYALWALDWHMWKMILNYLPPEAAALQARQLKEEGTEHGAYFNFEPLLNALNTYRQRQLWRSSEEQDHYWHHIIGRKQRLLPVHVMNEYCYPGRSFETLPDFTADNLPRLRTFYIHNWHLDVLFPLAYGEEEQLGTSCALLRSFHKVCMAKSEAPSGKALLSDYRCLYHLWIRRQSQFQKEMAKLVLVPENKTTITAS